jgi:antitoxin FitA
MLLPGVVTELGANRRIGSRGGSRSPRQSTRNSRTAFGVFHSPVAASSPRPVAHRATGAIIDSMAQLVVRNVDEAIVRALKLRAAARGVSAEAEHRTILREVLLAKHRKGASFKSALAALPNVGKDADFSFERDLDRPDGVSG